MAAFLERKVFRVLFAAGVVLAAFEPTAHAETVEAPLSGPPLVYAPKPVFEAETKACSMRVSVCVHAPASTPGARVLEILASAERTLETLTGALGLPAPDPDPETRTYDIYLVDGDEASTHLGARDVRSAFDRASAFTTLGAGIPSGCVLDGTMARELGRASLFRVAPATDEATALAQTTYLAELTVPCASRANPAMLDAIRIFQANPERAVTDRHVGDTPPLPATWSDPLTYENRRFAEGAFLFWSYVDRRFSRSPFGIVRALWALGPTTTPLGSARWNDEPDAFDILRTTFKDVLFTGSKLADLLLDAAVDRARLGPGGDDVTPATFDWDVPWPSSPRRFAPRAPVEPTGSSYVSIRRDGAPEDANLRVEITWEEHALFRWALVKIDENGAEIGRVVIPTTERATSAQLTLTNFGKAKRVLLVGVNVGDPAYAFDPNDEVWEPHGWLATLASTP